MMENVAEKLGISDRNVKGEYNESKKKFEYLIVHRSQEGDSIQQLKKKVLPFKNKMFQAHYTNYNPTSSHAVNGENVYVTIRGIKGTAGSL